MLTVDQCTPSCESNHEGASPEEAIKRLPRRDSQVGSGNDDRRTALGRRL
jgi:hypothetical protein